MNYIAVQHQKKEHNIPLLFNLKHSVNIAGFGL